LTETTLDSPGNAFKQSMRLLMTRRFGTFWFASLLSNIGTWAQQVAQPWLLLSLGASPFLLGLDSFALGGPVLALTLVGGVLADRVDRRSQIAWCQSIQMQFVDGNRLRVIVVLAAFNPWAWGLPLLFVLGGLFMTASNASANAKL